MLATSFKIESKELVFSYEHKFRIIFSIEMELWTGFFKSEFLLTYKIVKSLRIFGINTDSFDFAEVLDEHDSNSYSQISLVVAESHV